MAKYYSNLVQLLKNRGFIDLVRVNRNDKDYFLANYGPLGTLLRQNVLKRWWELMVLQQRSVFPIECPAFQTSSFVEHDITGLHLQKQEKNWRESLQQDCISKYLQVLTLTNGRLPVSIVSVGTCLSWRHVQNDDPEEKVLLFGNSNKTSLLLQNYTPPTGASTVLDYWLQLRLSWWKKFSRHPANFSVVSGNDYNSGTARLSTDTDLQNSQPTQRMCINYHFPWGPETIEVVRNLGDAHLSSLQQFGDQSYKGKTSGNKSCIPCCIECSSSVEAAMAAWLVDSFHDRQSFCKASKQERSKFTMVLQLHPQIAPYQVSIVMSSTMATSASAVSSLEMHHVCDKLEKEFQKTGISVFNASLHGSTLDALIKRNDQLGIPYTVIVTEVSLTDGLVNVRNRDTCIQTTSHISLIAEELGRNLNAQLEEHDD